MHHPQDDALVITLSIVDFTTQWILVDNGSSADILYYCLSTDEDRQRVAFTIRHTTYRVQQYQSIPYRVHYLASHHWYLSLAAH